MFNALRCFNLLILEEGEEYLTDCAATIEFTYPYSIVYPEGASADNLENFDVRKCIFQTTSLKLNPPEKGRLRVCSKSIIFEPDNVSADILKIPFRKITKLHTNSSKAIIWLCGKETVKVSTVVFNGKTRCVSPYTVTNATKAPIYIANSSEIFAGKKNISPLFFRSEEIGQQLNQYSHNLSSSSLSNFSALQNNSKELNNGNTLRSSLVYFFRIKLQQHYFSTHIYDICVNLWNVSKQEAKGASLTEVVKSELEKLTKFLYFDLSRLDHREVILLHTASGLWVNRVKPLVLHKGLFQVTTDNIFFQPYPNFSNKPFRRIAISSVLHVFRRISNLRPNALEIIADVTSEKGRKSKCLLVEFADNATREYIADILEKLKPKIFEVQRSRDFSNHIMSLWQKGLISNFHYLDFLNCIAGRSRNDFSQYPVFPWVLSDYSSSELDLNNPEVYRDLTKPVGALNVARLESLISRMNHLDTQIRESSHCCGENPDLSSSSCLFDKSSNDSAYLYGSHYSTPAFVVHWLIRLYPECQLRLHSGRFDAWMRMFHSMESSYKSVLSGQSTFMELIPEFYQQSDYFLFNRLNVVTSEGKLDDVELPLWASSSVDFLNKMRAALESEYVSRYLPDWIDLIFGYKQRGEEAREAHNLFHPLTYANATVAVSSGSCPIGVPNPMSPAVQQLINEMNAEALEVQLQEFGQTPIQLFSSPHLTREVCPCWELQSRLGDRWRDAPWFIYLLHNPHLLPSTSSVSSFQTLSASSPSITFSSPVVQSAYNTEICSADSFNTKNNSSGATNEFFSATEKSSFTTKLGTTPISEEFKSHVADTSICLRKTQDTQNDHNTISGLSDKQFNQLESKKSHLQHGSSVFNCSTSSKFLQPFNAWTAWSYKTEKTKNSVEFLIAEFICRDVEDVSVQSDSVCTVSQDGCLRMMNPFNLLSNVREQRNSSSISVNAKNSKKTDDKNIIPKVPMSYNTFRVSKVPLSSVTHLNKSGIVAIGAFDGSITLNAYQYLDNAQIIKNSGSKSRDFEWGGTAKQIDKQLCHADTVTCLAFENNFNGLVSGSADQTVRAWTVSPSGLAIVHVFEEFVDEVLSVAARNTLVLAASSNGQLVLWDLRSPTSIAWSSNVYPAYPITHCSISDRYVVAFAPESTGTNFFEEKLNVGEAGYCCHSLHSYSPAIPFHYWDLRKSSIGAIKLSDSHTNISTSIKMPTHSSNVKFSLGETRKNASTLCLSQHAMESRRNIKEENKQETKEENQFIAFTGLSDGGRYVIVGGNSHFSSSTTHVNRESGGNYGNCGGFVSLWDIHHYKELQKWNLKSISKPKFIRVWPGNSSIEAPSRENECMIEEADIKRKEEFSEYNLEAYIAVLDGDGRIELMSFENNRILKD